MVSAIDNVMRRVTEVWAGVSRTGGRGHVTPTAGGRYGTGYLVASQAVLTARHVVLPALGSPQNSDPDTAPSLLVRPLGERGVEVPGDWLRARVVWHDKPLDAALLEVEGETGVPGTVEWAEAEGNVPIMAIGFPVTEHGADRVYDTEQASGELALGSRWKSGHYVFRVTSNVGRLPEGAKERSSWEGMSGAALLADQRRVIGVIVKDYLPTQHEGHRLDAIPASDIIRAEGFRAAAEALGFHPQLGVVGAQWRGRLEPPPLPPHTIERPKLLGEIVQALVTGEAPVVALVGPGGFGKTTLGLQACRDPAVQQRCGGGVLRLTLGQAPNLAGELNRAFADLTGERASAASEEELAHRVLVELANRGAFLFIDDAWHAQPLSYLLGSERVPVLVTTRNRGLVQGRASKVVPVESFEESEARALLAPTGNLDTAEQAALGSLAQRLGGWPLLIALARAWLERLLETRKDLALVSAVARMAQHYDACGVTGFDAGKAVLDPEQHNERDRAVAATLQASLGDLPEKPRQQYTELAVFPPGQPVPLHVAADLWDMNVYDAERLLNELGDRSLLRFDGENVQLHSNFRDFLYRSLPHPPELHRALLARWGNPLELKDPYRLGQVAWQLSNAADDEALYALISLDWLEHTLHVTGSPAVFTADARTVADHAARKANRVQELRCRLVIARVRPRFRNIRPEICRVLAQLGEVGKALEFARIAAAHGNTETYYGRGDDDMFGAVARGCAEHDPARAAGIARTLIQEPKAKSGVLADVAIAVADRDEALSSSLAQEALDLYLDAQPGDWVVNRIAAAVAAADPARGERVAREIPVPVHGSHTDPAGKKHEFTARPFVLQAVAKQIACRDPDRAERLAREPSDEPNANVLALVSMAVAETNPAKAERLAREAIDIAVGKHVHAQQQYGPGATPIAGDSLTAAIVALAHVSPAEAVRRAREIPERGIRGQVLAHIAAAIVSLNRLRAQMLVKEAAQLASDEVEESARNAREKAEREGGYTKSPSYWVLGDLVPMIAAVDPDLAEQTARSIEDSDVRARALSRLAEVLPVTERQKALGLLDEALRVPPHEDWSDFPTWERAIYKVLETLASCDPDTAERAAGELGDLGIEPLRDRAYRALATGVARVDPGRAAKIARRLPPALRNTTLSDVAEAAAHVDPGAAVSIAKGVRNAEDRKWALIGVGKVIADQLPDQAERLAREILGMHSGAPLLASIGQALAVTDPARAERLAEELLNAGRNDPGSQASLQLAAAITLARIDADRAEAIASEIDGWYEYKWGVSSPLAAIARTVAAVDPDRAVQIAGRIATRYGDPSHDRSAALRAVAAEVAATGDIERALSLAEDASQKGPELWRGSSDPLPTILAVIARRDPARAYAVTREIHDPGQRAITTAAVAAASAVDAPTEKAIPLDVIDLVSETPDPEPLLTVVAAQVRLAARGNDCRFAHEVLQILIGTFMEWY